MKDKKDITGYCKSCAFINMCKKCQTNHKNDSWIQESNEIFTHSMKNGTIKKMIGEG